MATLNLIPAFLNLPTSFSSYMWASNICAVWPRKTIGNQAAYQVINTQCLYISPTECSIPHHHHWCSMHFYLPLIAEEMAHKHLYTLLLVWLEVHIQKCSCAICKMISRSIYFYCICDSLKSKIFCHWVKWRWNFSYQKSKSLLTSTVSSPLVFSFI